MSNREEREKAADRQRRSRAIRARNSLSCDSQRDAPPARVVNTHLPKEEEKESFALPSDWDPKDCHCQRVTEEGREPTYLKRVERLFRAWVAKNDVASHNWDAQFSYFLETHFLKFPSRRKVGSSPAHSTKTRASLTARQTQIPDGTADILVQIIRLMDEGKLSEGEIRTKLDVGVSEIREASRLRHRC